MNISKLNEIVVDSKLNKVQLAKMCNITRATLDNALNGSDIKISTLESLAKALGVSAGIFFDEDNGVTAVNSAVATGSGTANNSVNITTAPSGDSAVLAERVRSLETLIIEKNERINELKERIEELKAK